MKFDQEGNVMTFGKRNKPDFVQPDILVDARRLFA